MELSSNQLHAWEPFQGSPSATTSDQSCNYQDYPHKAVYSEAIFWGEANLSMNNKQSLFIWIETLASPPLSVCHIQCVITPAPLDRSQGKEDKKNYFRSIMKIDGGRERGKCMTQAKMYPMYCGINKKCIKKIKDLLESL